MNEQNQNKGPDKNKHSIGRRKFIFSTLGVILTGRCISFDQITFQSARAMGPAMAIGHASGCAAALAAKQNVPLRIIDVKKLQKLLLNQNAELRM